MLGYDVGPSGGRLVVNETEAGRVREIFQLCTQHHSLSAVVAELGLRRWETKSWKSKQGTVHSALAFTQVSLRRLFTNAIYAGKVGHRGAMYDGEHDAIVEPAVWEEVNAELRAGRRSRADVASTRQHALLAGLLFCRSCQRPMIATYTATRGRRYRYYVCQAARRNGWESCPTKSVAATVIEDSVVAQLGMALSAEEARKRLQVSDADWQVFFQGESSGLVRAVVKEIGYDGTTGAVSLKLGSTESRQ